MKLNHNVLPLAIAAVLFVAVWYVAFGPSVSLPNFDVAQLKTKDGQYVTIKIHTLRRNGEVVTLTDEQRTKYVTAIQKRVLNYTADEIANDPSVGKKINDEVVKEVFPGASTK
jgi:penicillin-binding protein-related factor A (putative recombinase)